jgi:hypothetical protein
MRVQIEEHIDGKLAESGAPQLIVFRVTQRGWEVVAAANFARLLPPGTASIAGIDFREFQLLDIVAVEMALRSARLKVTQRRGDG